MDEESFLSLLREHGADFRGASVADLEQRFGVTEWLGLRDWPMVVVPTKPLFPEHREPFHVSLVALNQELLPPVGYVSGLNLFPDARRNHALALERLMTTLAFAPRDISVSNALSHEWRVGDTRLSITSWTESSVSGLAKLRPEYAHNTRIAIESAWAPTWNDNEAREMTTRAQHLRIPSKGLVPQTAWSYHNRFRGFLRRNPAWLREQVGSDVVIWKDATSGHVGVSHRDVSLVIPSKYIRSLTLVRIEQARGPGSSHLELSLHDVYSKAQGFLACTLVRHNDEAGLDEYAKQASALFGIAATTVNGVND